MGVLTVADVRHRLDGLDPWYFNICPDGTVVHGDHIGRRHLRQYCRMVSQGEWDGLVAAVDAKRLAIKAYQAHARRLGRYARYPRHGVSDYETWEATCPLRNVWSGVAHVRTIHWQVVGGRVMCGQDSNCLQARLDRLRAEDLVNYVILVGLVQGIIDAVYAIAAFWHTAGAVYGEGRRPRGEGLRAMVAYG